MRKGNIAEALEWWHTLSRQEKDHWLQCEATPEEIDADLASPNPDIRDAAGIASVGDAWRAFRGEDPPFSRRLQEDNKD
jgi:hypothetical protein